MTRVTVAATGLAELQRALGEVPDETMRDARKVVARGSLNIKNDAKGRAADIRMAPHYARTISYDTEVRGTTITAEIGPDKAKGGQAHLGHIFEYGIPTTAPHPHLGPALDAETPKFERYVEQLGVDVLEAL